MTINSFAIVSHSHAIFSIKCNTYARSMRCGVVVVTMAVHITRSTEFEVHSMAWFACVRTRNPLRPRRRLEISHHYSLFSIGFSCMKFAYILQLTAANPEIHWVSVSVLRAKKCLTTSTRVGAHVFHVTGTMRDACLQAGCKMSPRNVKQSSRR